MLFCKSYFFELVPANYLEDFTIFPITIAIAIILLYFYQILRLLSTNLTLIVVLFQPVDHTANTTVQVPTLFVEET